MRPDGAAEQHRQGVEELIGLLYADTPLQTIRERACALARNALDAECVFLSITAVGQQRTGIQGSCIDATPHTAPEQLMARASARGQRLFEDSGSAAVAIPVQYGDIVLGAFAATDRRRREFTTYDADILDVYARYVAIAQSNYTKVGTWRRHLHVQRRGTWAVIAAAIVITIALSLYGWFSERLSAGHIASSARQSADISEDHFLRFVESATQLASTTAEVAPNFLGDRAGSEHLLRRMLESAPSDVVYGTGLWYEPYAFSPHVRLFGPYAHRVSGNGIVLTYEWSSRSYDYPTHAWYLTGERAGSSTAITRPYFDVDHIYISAVHPIRKNGQFLGVSTVDMTSQSIDLFLRHVSSPRHITYVSTLDGHVVAFPNGEGLIAYAKTRHPVKRILDVTDADAAAFIGSRYPGKRVSLRTKLASMPLVLNGSWDTAAFGAPEPTAFLPAIGLLVWALAAVVISVLRNARFYTQRALDVDRERARLLLEIDSRIKAEEALRRAAETDRLTGLPDRSALLDALAQIIEHRTDAENASSGLLLLDLNGLEGVNQTSGHLAGDEVLAQAASLIRRCCGENDVPARLGSDEFAVLLRGGAHERGRNISECIQRGLTSGLRIGGQTVFIDASAGFVEIGKEHQNAEDVIRDADYALTHTKHRGTTMTGFTPDLQAAANRERELQAALRGALARGELRVAYQPIYRLSDRSIVGVEALARWKRGDQVILPSEFIPVAERTGLVLDIDRHVAQTALRRLRALPQFADLRLSLNVSALHFKSPDAFRILEATLSENRLDRKLDVELTETAAMSLSGEPGDLLKQLHDTGIGMHLDDFGTGYSSLAYLQHLHVDALKIDRTFVAAMLEDERAMEIVDAIVQLARRLHIETIIEGIESALQERALRDLGATMGQGHFFAYPMDAQDLEGLLSAAAH